MTQDYYILSGKQRKGPYDLVMLVRKMRNGSLTSATMVQLGEDPAKPAAEWPGLKDFFNEKKDESTESADATKHRQRHLIPTLQSGWRFLQRNHISTVLAAVYILTIIVMASMVHMGLPPYMHITAYLIVFIFSNFLLSFYLLALLRMVRGQPVDIGYIFSKIGPVSRPLLTSSTLVSCPAIAGLVLLVISSTWMFSLVGLFIVAIPGLFILALYSFTPLVIIDQGYDFWDAMEMSRKTVLKGGLETLGVIFALFVINFLGGLLAILPMAITLPITMGALTEIYDESF